MWGSLVSKKAGWGWNEERTAWGSPAPYLKFRQGVVRQAPTPVGGWEGRGRRNGNTHWEGTAWSDWLRQGKEMSQGDAGTLRLEERKCAFLTESCDWLSPGVPFRMFLSLYEKRNTCSACIPGTGKVTMNEVPVEGLMGANLGVQPSYGRRAWRALGYELRPQLCGNRRGRGRRDC